MDNLPIAVQAETCVGCRLCVKACPFGAISMQGKLASIDLGKCTLCGACVAACKFGAIAMAPREEAPAAVSLDDYRDVWIFAEQKDGRIQSITYELLGEGRKLADALGCRLCAVLLGHGLAACTADLTARVARHGLRLPLASPRRFACPA